MIMRSGLGEVARGRLLGQGGQRRGALAEMTRG